MATPFTRPHRGRVPLTTALVAAFLLLAAACGGSGEGTTEASAQAPRFAGLRGSPTVQQGGTTIDPAVQAEIDALQDQINDLIEADKTLADADKALDGRLDTVEAKVGALEATVKALDESLKDLEDAALTEGDVQKIVDDTLVKFVTDEGILSGDELTEMVEGLVDDGVEAGLAGMVEEKFSPVRAPQSGVQGDNPCLNRENGSDFNQWLIDIGNLRKWQDTANPAGVPDFDPQVANESFANWTVPDPATDPDGYVDSLEKVYDLIQKQGAPKGLNDPTPVGAFKLQEDAQGVEYWCAGTEGDGTYRSGVRSLNALFPAGKWFIDLGNQVAIVMDCNNPSLIVGVPDKPDTPTSTTSPNPSTTSPTSSTTPTTSPTSSTTSTKPPVSTTSAPPTTAAPADSTPPATSPVTLAEDPDEVSDPEPVDTVPDATVPAQNPPCASKPAGMPGSCRPTPAS
jgi:hypothetical protein